MFGGFAQSCGDSVVVIRQFRRIARHPRELVGVYGFTIDNGADLVVAGTEIKADTISFEVAPQRNRCFRGVGNNVDGFDGEWGLVDPGHEFDIESAGSCRRVDLLKMLDHVGRS